MKFFAQAASAALLLVAAAWTAAAQEVGNTSAVIPSASQQAPQGTRSDLNLSDPIIRNAELATAERGALEVTFLDGSKLTMGQNSRLTVDEYVYAGPGGANKQTIRYTKGLFRFVSGSIAKDQVKLQTPTVTIGIRGTVIRMFQGTDGEGKLAVESGEADITENDTGKKVTLYAGQIVDFAPGFLGAPGPGTIVGCQ
jgi:hypothetical protein